MTELSSPAAGEEKPPSYEDLEKQPPPSYDETVGANKLNSPNVGLWIVDSVEQIKEFFWL